MVQQPQRPGFGPAPRAVEPHRVDRPPGDGSVVIDCDDCAVRGVGCQDCVVSVLLGTPDTLRDDERQALEVLADVGMAPRLRLVPIHRQPRPGGGAGAA